MDLFVWLESTGLAAWVRESSSLWAYPTILFMHSLGMTIVVGLGIALDLRVMGLGSDMPLSPLQKCFPYLWAGFAINAVSGLLLLIADATTKFANPIFYLKLLFIALAVVATVMIRSKVFGTPGVDKVPVTSTSKFVALASLIFWIGAITAGRLMAYLGPVSGLN
jgi:hypothetical protein